MKSKTQKQEEAAARQAEYSALSMDEKIRRAKASPGNSKRQLEKLMAEKSNAEKSGVENASR